MGSRYGTGRAQLSGPRTWPVPAVITSTQTTRYGAARAMASGRLHPQLASHGGWGEQ